MPAYIQTRKPFKYACYGKMFDTNRRLHSIDTDIEPYKHEHCTKKHLLKEIIIRIKTPII